MVNIATTATAYFAVDPFILIFQVDEDFNLIFCHNVTPVWHAIITYILCQHASPLHSFVNVTFGQVSLGGRGSTKESPIDIKHSQ